MSRGLSACGRDGLPALVMIGSDDRVAGARLQATFPRFGQRLSICLIIRKNIVEIGAVDAVDGARSTPENSLPRSTFRAPVPGWITAPVVHAPSTLVDGQGAFVPRRPHVVTRHPRTRAWISGRSPCPRRRHHCPQTAGPCRRRTARWCDRDLRTPSDSTSDMSVS